MRIMTGAPFPKGSNTAVRQEDTDYGEDIVSIYKEQKEYDNYCKNVNENDVSSSLGNSSDIFVYDSFIIIIKNENNLDTWTFPSIPTPRILSILPGETQL